MKLVSFKPLTPKEQLIAARLGNDEWEVLVEDDRWVKGSILVCKEIDLDDDTGMTVKHMRWIDRKQVLTGL